MTDEEIKSHLLATNMEFRRLFDEHHECETKLQAIYGNHMSEAEHIEEVNIKKRKLQLKDHMSGMIRKFRNESLSHQPI